MLLNQSVPAASPNRHGGVAVGRAANHTTDCLALAPRSTAGNNLRMDDKPHGAVSGSFRPVFLALVLILPTYVLSFGPACWLTSQQIVGGFVVPHPVMRIYWPLGALAMDGNTLPGRCLRRWMTLGLRPGHSAIVPTKPAGYACLATSDD